MNKQTIKAAAEKAVKNGEDLQLYQAVSWFEDYGLIDFRTSRALYDALVKARCPSDDD